MRFGIDWAWGSINVATLRSSGVTFVLRYLSYDPSKDLRPSEAAALSKGGIDIVVVWETTAARALAGYDAGVSDARMAKQLAAACGKPDNRPIFFAVDEDMTGRAGQVCAYFKGASDILGKGRRGGYGGYDTLKTLFDAGLIDFGIQTVSWSRGHREGRAHMLQYSFNHVLGGVGIDWDQAIGDFGQWRVGEVAPPPPPPYWFLLPDERQRVLEWNSLRGNLSIGAHLRRVKLRNWMVQRRKAIYVNATKQNNGWNTLHRYLRYQTLKEYTVDRHHKSSIVLPHD